MRFVIVCGLALLATVSAAVACSAASSSKLQKYSLQMEGWFESIGLLSLRQ